MPVDDAVEDRWNRIDPQVPPDDEDDRWNRAESSQQPKTRRRTTTPLETDDNLMKVSATSSPQSVALSINHAIFDEQQMPIIRAIGAGAVAQACKGIAIARGYVATRGHDLGTTIGFDTIKGETGSDISAQTFRLFLR
jgi:stage V sporulation protein S